MIDCVEIVKCRLCGSDRISNIIDLGHSPLANSFLSVPEDQPKYPLVVYLCAVCGCIGLKHTVEARVLFDNYAYESSTALSFRTHFENYANTVFEYCSLKKGDLAIDIGSNDGILMRPMEDIGLVAIGVEPASKLAAKCVDNGLIVINKYFNVDVADFIVKEHGIPALITCNNCFAHLDDFDDFMKGLKVLMDKDTWFVIENAYWLDTFLNCDIGQVYHEHKVYHTVTSLKKYLRSHGMEIYHLERNKVQCGSIRVYIKKTRDYKYSKPVSELLRLERLVGLFDVSVYANFMAKINEKKHALIKLLDSFGDAMIVGYGWPAKATTLVGFYGIGHYLKYVVEDAEAKQGLVTPAANLNIYHKEKIERGCYVLILAYNYAMEIIENNKSIGATWVIPLPEVKVVI